MDHLAHVGKVNIEHKLNTGKEKRIGKYFCDGFDSENNVVYEMDGCFFHGHRCHFGTFVGKGFVSVQKRVKHENQCVNVGANLLQDLKKFQCEFNAKVSSHVCFKANVEAAFLYSQNK